MIEQSHRFEALRVRLPEPAGAVQEISAVLGTPEWWPSGARIAVALAHGSGGNMDDPILLDLHERLTLKRFLALRFNFPFAEAGRRSGTDSVEVMERAFRAALSVLGRDMTNTPAQLVLGGKGAGAAVAARLGTARLRIGGLLFLGFPLHPQDRKEKVQAESLYRITAPMLFVQGTRDRRCDVATLREILRGVGAPTRLHVCEDADQNFKVPKRSLRNEAEVRDEVFGVVYDWLENVVGEG